MSSTNRQCEQVSLFLNNITESENRTGTGRALQSFGATASKARSPRVLSECVRRTKDGTVGPEMLVNMGEVVQPHMKDSVRVSEG